MWHIHNKIQWKHNVICNLYFVICFRCRLIMSIVYVDIIFTGRLRDISSLNLKHRPSMTNVRLWKIITMNKHLYKKRKQTGKNPDLKGVCKHRLSVAATTSAVLYSSCHSHAPFIPPWDPPPPPQSWVREWSFSFSVSLQFSAPTGGWCAKLLQKEKRFPTFAFRFYKVIFFHCY